LSSSYVASRHFSVVPQPGVKENLLYFLPHNLKQKNLKNYGQNVEKHWKPKLLIG